MKHLTVTVRGMPAGTTTRQAADNFNASIHHESPCFVGPIVEELQGNTCSTTVTFQKEKKGNKRDCEALKERFHRSPFGGLQSTISVDDGFLGLNALFGRADAPIHVYFVHGLGGHAFKTWSSDVQHGDIKTLKAWPRDFLPKRLMKDGVNARIYSLGYNANVIRKAAPNATISSAAEDLLAALRSDRSQHPPKDIYFVCHSLGGIVVCQSLNMALFEDEEAPSKEAYRNLFVHDDRCLLKGVVLMGTPLRGSGQANMMAPIVRLVKGLNFMSATNDSFIKALRENNDTLDIPTIVQRFKAVIEAKSVRLLVACEQEPYIGSSLTTDYESAVSIFRDIVTPFRIEQSDHSSMVKFEDPNETRYKQLENLIVKMLQSNPANRNFSPETSIRPSSHGGNVMYDPLRNINLTINMQQAQSSPFQAPSRQQTDPTAHHSPDPRSHMDRSPLSQNGEHRPRPVGRAQTERLARGPDDGDPFNRLGLFDTAFIIDDTGSMNLKARDSDPTGPDRWDVTKQAVQHIAGIAAEHDPDGVDVRFLMSDLQGDNLSKGEDVDSLLQRIHLMGGGTYFRASLEELLQPRLYQYEFYQEEQLAYRDNLKHALRSGGRKPQPPIRPRPFNLIVITDGAAEDRPEVENYIVSVALKLEEMAAPPRHVGIQFVQVGQDAEAKKWLDHLDNDLRSMRDPPIRDIVDTTPFDSHLIDPDASLARILEDVLVFNVLQKVALGGVTEEQDSRLNAPFVSEMGG